MVIVDLAYETSDIIGSHASFRFKKIYLLTAMRTGN